MSELMAWAAGIALYVVSILAGTLLFIAMLAVATQAMNLDARAPAVQITTVLCIVCFAIYATRRLFKLIVARSLRRRSL